MTEDRSEAEPTGRGAAIEEPLTTAEFVAALLSTVSPPPPHQGSTAGNARLPS